MGKVSCSFCSKKCRGDVLKVGDRYFHKECFTCKVCHQKLEDKPFFNKDNEFFCPSDFKKYCAADCFFCRQKIVGEVVTALDHSFHKDCFKCSMCQRLFAAGDKVSMRNREFLCSVCTSSYLTSSVSHSLHHKSSAATATLPSKPAVSTAAAISRAATSPIHRLYDTEENGYTVMNSHQHSNKDYAQISTVPLRRKQGSNSDSYSQKTEELRRPVSTSNRSNLDQAHTADSDGSGIRVSTLAIPRHFHVPSVEPARTWALGGGSVVVGSKSHPLALSASQLHRPVTTAARSQPPSGGSATVSPSHRPPPTTHGGVRRLASYPAGCESGSELAAIERDDFPGPPAAHTGLLADRNRRKMQNPTVEALSASETPRVRKGRSSSASNKDQNDTSNRQSMADVIKRSTTDCSPSRAGEIAGPATYPRTSAISQGDHVDLAVQVPQNPISASRCPSASCEPLVPPRYEVHLETSPSRNDEYFRSTDRHLGYSMEFVNSTSRAFLGDNSISNSRQSLRHSYDPRLVPNELNGLRKVRTMQSGRINGVASQGCRKTTSDNEESSITNKNDKNVIPYGQLRLSKLKKLRYLDRTQLETYLSEEEFEKVFKLPRPVFYRLPEWKRNDLKKRVDLF